MKEFALSRVKLSPTVKEALEEHVPVVALESTVIAHGLPYPDNIEVTKEMIAAIKRSGAVPAIIGLIDGFIRIGLTEQEVNIFAQQRHILKVSRSDISYCLMKKELGATTVSATMFCAALAGISIFSTGGLGGVHRGAETTFDISADLTEFTRTPVLVVCSGAKSILDIPKTLEYLETQGIPVVGYQTDYFPLFFTRESPHDLVQRVDNPNEMALLAQTHWSLGLNGIVVANPIPQEASLAFDEVEEWITVATREAMQRRITGKSVTPFILRTIAELSSGRTRQANQTLLIHNAYVAGQIATSLYKERLYAFR